MVRLAQSSWEDFSGQLHSQCHKGPQIADTEQIITVRKREYRKGTSFLFLAHYGTDISHPLAPILVVITKPFKKVLFY